MALNCKPEQMAWIDIPRTRSNATLGLDQLQGHVVQTKRLHPAFPADTPTWIVEPPQSVRIPASFQDIGSGCRMNAGDVLHAAGIPDAYLRPFEDLSPQEFEDLARELTT